MGRMGIAWWHSYRGSLRTAIALRTDYDEMTLLFNAGLCRTQRCNSVNIVITVLSRQ
jgi:hypothetical protein